MRGGFLEVVFVGGIEGCSFGRWREGGFVRKVEVLSKDDVVVLEE